MTRLSAALLLSLLLGIPVPSLAEDTVTNPFAGDEAAIEEGGFLFEAVCAGYCHVKAEADRDGKCPNLFDCEWVEGSGTDAEMFEVVSEGVPKTEMVGFAGQLPDEMIWQILAYVRAASKCEPSAAADSRDAPSSTEMAGLSAHE